MWLPFLVCHEMAGLLAVVSVACSLLAVIRYATETELPESEASLEVLPEWLSTSAQYDMEGVFDEQGPPCEYGHVPKQMMEQRMCYSHCKQHTQGTCLRVGNNRGLMALAVGEETASRDSAIFSEGLCLSRKNCNEKEMFRCSPPHCPLTWQESGKQDDMQSSHRWRDT